MKAPRIDIGSIRREQIVDAAVSVIAERGLQHLSLSAIEHKVGMSRGQLTYYFKAKEDILLGVFDRMLQLMCQQQGHGAKDGDPRAKTWMEMFRIILEYILRQPPANREFNALQFTFLSQIGHRGDFRARLAKLYEEWRTGMTQSIVQDLKRMPSPRKVSPRALATLAQAILHGVAVQTAAQPDAFDRQEIIELCVDLLRSYVWPAPLPRRRGTHNGAPAAKRRRARAHANGVKR
jgi:AcrR family transcriptional regulator